jgi:hypothetical protein
MNSAFPIVPANASYRLLPRRPRRPRSSDPANASYRRVGLMVFTSRLRPNQHALRVFNQRVGKLQQSLP